MVNRPKRKQVQVKPYDASVLPVKRQLKTSAKHRSIPKKAAPKATKKVVKQKKVDTTDYVVENVVGIRRMGRSDTKIELLLQWEGYPEWTWENIANAACKDLMKPFEAALKSLKSSKSSHKKAAGDVADGDQYEVEEIIGIHFDQEDRQIEFLVKWQGYPYTDITWEPLGHVEQCEELLVPFQAAYEHLAALFNPPSPKKSGKRTAEKKGEAEEEPEEEEEEMDNGENEDAANTVSPPKKGRGRPKTQAKKASANDTPARSSSRRARK